MAYRALADMIVVMHFFWILFMLSGFVLTVRGFFHAGFFDRWLFRMLHLLGILYVGLLTLLREHCPLTILENVLRQKYDPGTRYSGSFIVHYIGRVVYPDVDPAVIIIPTIIIALFTLTVFILRPPAKVRQIWGKTKRGEM